MVEVGPLEEGREDVLDALCGASEHDLMRRPADGGWNAWEVAYHLLDIERWHIAKLCEAATGDRAEALARFAAIWSRLRDEAIALTRAVPEERLDTLGLLTGIPDWTPRRLITAIAVHDHAHAAQIRAAMSGTGETETRMDADG